MTHAVMLQQDIFLHGEQFEWSRVQYSRTRPHPYEVEIACLFRPCPHIRMTERHSPASHEQEERGCVTEEDEATRLLQQVRAVGPPG